VCDNLGRNKDSKSSELLGNDVLEAPDKTVSVSDSPKATWSYGTMGFGVDLARTVWPEQDFRFHSQQKPLTEVQGQALHDLGPPNRVAKDILARHPADCLMIDGCDTEVWSSWMSSAPAVKRPIAVLFFAQAVHLEMESGAASKTHRKSMEKLGYLMQFWLMEAGDFGSAASQLRLGALHTQETSDQPDGPTQPAPNKLPVRPMSNLLMPFGVPSAAWTKMVPKVVATDSRCLPCVSKLSFGRAAPIFDPQEPMPDVLDSWV
jgi:hypothetical protein